MYIMVILWGEKICKYHVLTKNPLCRKKGERRSGRKDTGDAQKSQGLVFLPFPEGQNENTNGKIGSDCGGP